MHATINCSRNFKGLRLLLRQSLAEDLVAMKSTKAQIASPLAKNWQQVKTRIDELVLRSPQAGVLVGGAMNQLVGQYLSPVGKSSRRSST